MLRLLLLAQMQLVALREATLRVEQKRIARIKSVVWSNGSLDLPNKYYVTGHLHRRDGSMLFEMVGAQIPSVHS